MLLTIKEEHEGRKLLLKVHSYYSGLTIKKKIEYQYKFNTDEYELVYNSTIFKNNDTVSELNITDGGTMFLLRKIDITKSKGFIICVKSMNGRADKFYVKPSTSIEALKSMIFKETHTPPYQMRLISAGKQLEDGRLISDYNIQEGTVLMLLLRLSGS